MVPSLVRKEFPVPSLTVFVILQVLDVFTTLLGLQMGASEASVFVGQMMHTSPVAGLMIAKLFAVFLVLVAIRLKRPRIVVFINYWFAAVVSWNLAMLMMVQIRGV